MPSSEERYPADVPHHSGPRTPGWSLAAAVTMLLTSCVSAVRDRDAHPRSAARASSRGEHFLVVVHFASPAAAEKALSVAEAAWPHVAALFGADARPADAPLEIHLYRTSREYEKAERSLTGGRFRRNLAFSHVASRTSHIALQPPVPDETLERLVLPTQVLRLVAHEAAHVATYHATRNARWLPGWLDEGAASWIEQQVMIEMGLSPPRQEDDPWASTYLWRVAQLLEKDELPPLTDILRDRLGALSLTERYAVRKALFSFLAEEHLPRQRALLRFVRRSSSGQRLGEELIEELKRLFVDRTLDAVDAQFRRFVSGFSPRWVEDHRSLTWTPEGWVQLAFPSADAVAWRATGPGRREYTISGAVEFFPGRDPRMHVFLGRSPGGYLDIRFEAGRGVRVVRVRRRGGEGDEDRLAELRSEAVVVGRRVPFEVRVTTGRVRVELIDQGSVVVPLGGLEADAPWGLGAARGTAGRWHALRVTGPRGTPVPGETSSPGSG